jgi:leucyl aminopeptidase
MEINVSLGNIVQQDVSAVIINLFEDVKISGGATGELDKLMDGVISDLISDGEVTGKKGEITLIHTLGKIPAKRIIVLGLGKVENFDTNVIRWASGVLARHIRRIGVNVVATIVHGSDIGGLNPRKAASAMVEGILLGLYKFDNYKSDKGKKTLERLTVMDTDSAKVADVEAGVLEGIVIAEAVNRCRNMANEPANLMTPTNMAEAALDIANNGAMEIQVLERVDMERLKMGAFLGVSQGSAEPPKMIVLRYLGNPSDQQNICALIGKGITFDSGGISIKPSTGMGKMKGDMAGGAAVLCAMQAVAAIKPRINILAIVPATENMPGGKAQRPGDIVTTMSGKTIEVDNTDAEGRLVIADAITYAQSEGATRIIDVATLTGAITTALGNVCTGVFGNDQELVAQVVGAGDSEGEPFWQFPMFEDYKKQYKSDVADLKNTGGRSAGSIIGAQTIGEFVDGASWVHLDIAGTSRSDAVSGHIIKGATGTPVRTLVRLLRNLAAK